MRHIITLILLVCLLSCQAWMGCGSDETELPLSTSGELTTLAIEKLAYVTENVPASPSVTYTVPITAITHFETSFEYPDFLIKVYATVDDTDYIWVYTLRKPQVENYEKLEENEASRPNTYRVEDQIQQRRRIHITWYFEGGYSTNTIYIDLSNFSLVNPEDAPKLIVEDPVEEPVEPPIDNPPQQPIRIIPRGEYVVWLEKVDGHCQSGVIHGDYVYIDAENKTLTFTGPDGEVDPGDPVREYIKVETGYTYEQASERAPEILKECPL